MFASCSSFALFDSLQSRKAGNRAERRRSKWQQMSPIYTQDVTVICDLRLHQLSHEFNPGFVCSWESTATNSNDLNRKVFPDTKCVVSVSSAIPGFFNHLCRVGKIALPSHARVRVHAHTHTHMCKHTHTHSPLNTCPHSLKKNHHKINCHAFTRICSVQNVMSHKIKGICWENLLSAAPRNWCSVCACVCVMCDSQIWFHG